MVYFEVSNPAFLVALQLDIGMIKRSLGGTFACALLAALYIADISPDLISLYGRRTEISLSILTKTEMIAIGSIILGVCAAVLYCGLILFAVQKRSKRFIVTGVLFGDAFFTLVLTGINSYRQHFSHAFGTVASISITAHSIVLALASLVVGYIYIMPAESWLSELTPFRMIKYDELLDELLQ